MESGYVVYAHIQVKHLRNCNRDLVINIYIRKYGQGTRDTKTIPLQQHLDPFFSHRARHVAANQRLLAFVAGHILRLHFSSFWIIQIPALNNIVVAKYISIIY